MFSLVNCLLRYDETLVQHLEQRLITAGLGSETTLRTDGTNQQRVILSCMKPDNRVARHMFDAQLLRDPARLAELDRAINVFLTSWP
jgi:hypothetical protein